MLSFVAVFEFVSWNVVSVSPCCNFGAIINVGVSFCVKLCVLGREWTLLLVIMLSETC
jgi:hypothetical protein